MGTCHSRTRAADVLPHTGKQSRKSKNSTNALTRQKLKLEIQKYDATNPSVFSPSGTRETMVVTPSSSLPSPPLRAETNDTLTGAEHKQYGESKKTKPLMHNPIENTEIEVQMVSNTDSKSASAVSSSLVDQFERLKMQVQQADNSTKRRKRREKVASRKEMVNEYENLWQEYEEIQNKVNGQDNCEGIPESISFLKDSDAWYIDFHSIHHQQQAPYKNFDPSNPSAANLSLLPQASIEAQKEFFKKKKVERKQRKKRKGSFKPMAVRATSEDQSASPQSLGMLSVQESARGHKNLKAVRTMQHVSGNDYKVPYRNRSSPTAQHTESYLHQTLSNPEHEAAVPSSITLDKNFPRKRNEDLPSIRRLDYVMRESERNGRRSSFDARKQIVDSGNPISEMSKEQFLMMCSPKSALTDENSTVYERVEALKRYEDETPWRSSRQAKNPASEMSNASQAPTKSENYSSEKANVEKAAQKPRTVQQETSTKMKPSIEYMSKADFLRMSALADPMPISALPGHLPMTIGDPTFDDSQVMSKISCEDTFMSPGGNQETIEEVVDEVSTSTDEDEEEDCYAWDGHMDDEDFWDMDVRRQSLDHIDELASQVSSQISTLLSKFRKDNNSIQTRSVKL